MENDFIMVLVKKDDREKIEDCALKEKKTLTKFCEDLILNSIKNKRDRTNARQISN